MHEVAHVGRRGNLALVYSAVPVLGKLDQQYPVVLERAMYHPEALVVRVRVTSHRQQVDVSVSDPRYLKQYNSDSN